MPQRLENKNQVPLKDNTFMPNQRTSQLSCLKPYDETMLKGKSIVKVEISHAHITCCRKSCQNILLPYNIRCWTSGYIICLIAYEYCFKLKIKEVNRQHFCCMLAFFIMCSLLYYLYMQPLSIFHVNIYKLRKMFPVIIL